MPKVTLEIHTTPEGAERLKSALASGELAEVGGLPIALGPAPMHTRDADCTRLTDDGDCKDCGVTAGDPCAACDGERFHAHNCPRSDGFYAPEGCNECRFGLELFNGNEIHACDECSAASKGFQATNGADLAAAFVDLSLDSLGKLRSILWPSPALARAIPLTESQQLRRVRDVLGWLDSPCPRSHRIGQTRKAESNPDICPKCGECREWHDRRGIPLCTDR